MPRSFPAEFRKRAVELFQVVIQAWVSAFQLGHGAVCAAASVCATA
jgi:hypothetical protein